MVKQSSKNTTRTNHATNRPRAHLNRLGESQRNHSMWPPIFSFTQFQFRSNLHHILNVGYQVIIIGEILPLPQGGV